AAGERKSRKRGLRHPLWQDRPARRPANAGPSRGRLEERRSSDRFRAGTANHSRSARLDPRRQASLSAPASYRRWGIAFGLFGVLAFSLRPILIKLSYAAYPVSPTTLLF